MWLYGLMTAWVLQLGGPQPAGEAPEDPYGLAITTASPRRESLFRLRSEQQFIAELGRDFAWRYPDEVFLRPVAADRFDRADAPTLGASWFQNRRSGTGQDSRGRRGDMGVQRGAGVLPPQRFEAAVLNEAPSSERLRVSVDIQLADDAGRFGLLFGALDPDRSLAPVDQRQWNTFYFAWCSRENVAIGRSDAGQRTVLAEAVVPPQSQFRLEVIVADGRIRVARNGEQVLDTSAGQPFPGRYVGVIGRSDAAPIRFDDFSAVPYAGTLVARTFAPSVRGLPAPGVRYRPIYFEHVGIERYGHHLGNLVQPPLEHGAFFLDALALPLRLPHEPPWECQTDVGYCRPGDVVWPFRLSFPDW
jgi:hypothetical protein